MGNSSRARNILVPTHATKRNQTYYCEGSLLRFFTHLILCVHTQYLLYTMSTSKPHAFFVGDLYDPYDINEAGPSDATRHRVSRQYLPPCYDIFESPRSEIFDGEAPHYCRSAGSTNVHYWRNARDRERWQESLVRKLVRAKYARLNQTQHPLLRYARGLVKAEKIELWYRLKELRVSHKLHRRQEKKAEKA
ncbi:hypothetical protein F4774DRAFT_427065 [Daldinia eschscholtzii]|nr:hypothetical protein F4774DRAFT_427065 [Daldinia eschscholtzii]